MQNLKKPVVVAVTGAAGQIGYSLLFRIAAGNMLGSDQPVTLKLLDLPGQQSALEGVAMELRDCAFPLLDRIVTTDDPETAFADADVAMLVGAKPRGKGMERKDLLAANASIFSIQGKALNAVASRDVKVVVVGNPANTNAWIAQRAAPDLNPRNFTALMRLDHNRTLAQLADKLACPVKRLRRVIVWGNHSSTQYPDLFHARLDEEALWPKINDIGWLTDALIPRVQKRGAEIISLRGVSSAGSAADAAIAHVRDWALGADDWTTMAVPSDGSYGIPEGVVYGFPVICEHGDYRIVDGLTVSEFSRERMEVTYRELLEEQDAVKSFIR